jgi:hypothetical protein
MKDSLNVKESVCMADGLKLCMLLDSVSRFMLHGKGFI